MVNIDVFWSIVQSNANHIKTLNHEMGSVQSSIEAIQQLNTWMLGCMASTFFIVLGTLIAVIRNIYWVKKSVNGVK